MSGMREGLLVVDRNRSHRFKRRRAPLFNASRKTLDAQATNRLTRNPAIYSAFLDALQGTERSGVKVERMVRIVCVDLRVVPLATNGKSSTAQARLVFSSTSASERLEQMRQEFLSNIRTSCARR